MNGWSSSAESRKRSLAGHRLSVMSAVAAKMALVLAFLQTAPVAGAAVGGVLERIASLRTPAGLEVRIQVNGFTDARISYLDYPNRIVLDITGVESIAASPVTRIDVAGVQKVRVGQLNAQVARVVFDIEGAFPIHKLDRVADGLLIFFPDGALPAAAPVQSPAASIPEKIDPVSPKIDPPVPPAKNMVSLPEKSDAGKVKIKAAEAIQTTEPAKVLPAPPPEKKQVEVKSSPKTTAAAPRPNPFSTPRRSPISGRVIVSADFFSPRQTALLDRYGRGPDFGGEIDLELWPFGDVWLSLDHFGATAVDPIDGTERSLSLTVPAAGLKFRMTGGLLSPYVGAGAAYFFHRERADSGVVGARGLGFTASAGLILRIGRVFVLDGFVRYKRGLLALPSGEIDAGGFHFGGGLGLVF